MTFRQIVKFISILLVPNIAWFLGQYERMMDIKYQSAADLLAHGGRIARQEWCGKGYVYRDKTLETLVLVEKAGDGEAVTEGWTPVADDVAALDWFLVED